MTDHRTVSRSLAYTAAILERAQDSFDARWRARTNALLADWVDSIKPHEATGRAHLEHEVPSCLLADQAPEAFCHPNSPEQHMTKPAWTPGPWYVVQNVLVYAGIDFKRVATCNDTDRRAPEMQANARLIAAAPDLYEALTAFLAGADAGHVSVEVDNAAHAALSLARSGRDGNE